MVIGGGPTGVELAGRAGRDRRAHAGARLPPLRSAHHARDPDRGRPARPADVLRGAVGARRASSWRALGIEVRTGTPVSDLGADFVEIGDERIATRTVLWAAGVRASPLTAHLGVPLDRGGSRLGRGRSVGARSPRGVRGRRPDRQDPGRQAAARRRAAGRPERPPRRAATSCRSVDGQPRLPFRYVDKGSMATIGRHKAVAPARPLPVLGLVAWWLWLTVHLLSLVGFRSRHRGPVRVGARPTSPGSAARA